MLRPLRRIGLGLLLALLPAALSAVAAEQGASSDAAEEGGESRGAEDATDTPPGLFLTYPVFADTPSPNTTARLDYALAKQTDEGDALEHQLRLEGQFAPVRWLGLGLVIPYTIADRDEAPNRHNLDDVEVGLKLASFGLESSGVLLGGGMALTLPTGNSDNEIGSDRRVWIRPFVDGGLRRGPVEATAFLRFAVPANENGDDPDWALAWNGSLLVHLTSIAAAVVELDGERTWGGDVDGETIVNVSPGLRWNPADDPNLWFATGVQVPVTNDERFDVRWQLSAYYQF
jgi:hypothetical protein